MEQGRKIQVLAVLALMIATMSLLVGFSSLNAQLELAGTANIKNNKWNVQVGSISNVQSTNSAYASFINQPTVNINNSKQIDFGIMMNQPGQMLSFKFSIVNKGTTDAKVSDIVLSGLNGYENYVTFNLEGISVDTIIAAGETVENVTVTVTYNPAPDGTLLENGISLNNLSVFVGFVQI